MIRYQMPGSYLCLPSNLPRQGSLRWMLLPIAYSMQVEGHSCTATAQLFRLLNGTNCSASGLGPIQRALLMCLAVHHLCHVSGNLWLPHAQSHCVAASDCCATRLLLMSSWQEAEILCMCLLLGLCCIVLLQGLRQWLSPLRSVLIVRHVSGSDIVQCACQLDSTASWSPTGSGPTGLQCEVHT